MDARLEAIVVRCVLRIEMIGFDDELDIRRERNEDDIQDFGLSM